MNFWKNVCIGNRKGYNMLIIKEGRLKIDKTKRTKCSVWQLNKSKGIKNRFRKDWDRTTTKNNKGDLQEC